MNTKEAIFINSKNYKSYIPLDIVAFDYAATGAMGDAGGVNIITRQGAHYYFNRVSGDLDENQIAEILPFVPYHNIPDSWSDIYMGMGNELYIRKEYYDSLHSSWNEFAQTEEGQKRIFYNVWQRLVLSVLKQ